MKKIFLWAAILLIMLVGPILAAGGQAGKSAKQDVKLTFWTFQEPDKRYFDRRVLDFNAKNPDIQLTMESANFPYEEMHDKLMVAIMSGSGAPDLCDVEIAKMGLFMKGNTIPFYDLTDLFKKPEYKGKFFEPKFQAFTYFGKVWGVPQDIDIGVVYYNTEIFKNAGVDFDSIKTWSDFVSAGKKITKHTNSDGDPDIVMTTVEVNDFHGTLGIAKQMGGGVYDAKGNLLLTSKANIDALQMCQDWLYKDKIAIITPGGYTHDATFFAFANAGKTATVLMPSWYMNRFTDSMPALNGKMAMRPLPMATPGGKRSYMSGGTCTVIVKQTDPKKAEIAKSFLEFAKMSYDSNLLFGTEVGFDPWRMDVYDDPLMQKPLAAFNNEPVFTMIRGLLRNNQVTTDYVGPLYAAVLEQFRENIPFRVFRNREDPKTVLNDALKLVMSRAN